MNQGIEREIVDGIRRFLEEQGVEEVRLGKSEVIIAVPLILQVAEERLQNSGEAPCWWPPLCEEFLRDVVDTILAGMGVVEREKEEMLAVEDPVATAYRRRQGRMEEMGEKDLDCCAGEQLITAEEIVDSVCRGEKLFRESLFFAAAIRLLRLHPST